MTNFDPKAIEVSLAVKGTVESTAQGVFIGAVKDMPTVALVDDIIVLYVGEGDEYENGRFYQYDIQSDSWEVLSVNAQDFGLTPGTVVTVGPDGSLTSSEVSDTTLSYIANVTSDVQEQLDELASGVMQAERRIDAVETNLTAVTGRVEAVESSVTEITQSVSEIQQNVTNISESVTNITEQIAEVTGDTTEIQQDITSIQSDVSTAQQDITSLKSRMTQAESDIDSLESSVASAQSDISSQETRISALETTVAGKQDAITGGATSILTDDLTADRALVSDAEGKVAVSNVTSTEIEYLDGAKSNIQSQIDALKAYAEALGGFSVQTPASLPESGESNTIYFVPSEDPDAQDVKIEYMWIDGAWERIGSSAFKLTIAQDASGISINDTALQTANTARAGLMPASYVTAVDNAQEDITTLQNNVSTINQNIMEIQGDVSSIEGSVTTINQSISTINESLEQITGEVQAAGPLSGTGITIASDGRTVNHTNAVTAGSAGSATAIPVITYDAQGHITAMSSATAYPPTTVGTANQYWRSQGSGVGAWTTPATSPASGSSTLITAGGVYTALQDKADASDVESVEGETITGITFSNGTLTLMKSSGGSITVNIPMIYYGTSAPSSSVGRDGDIYVQYSN